MRLILALVVIAMLSSSCNEEGNIAEDQEILQINYGTSFGECLGYCQRTLKIDNDSIIFVKSGWSPEIFDIRCSETYDDFSDLSALISYEKFIQLDETIGCPDCADGGAEWIEIVSVEGNYKITYEYGHPPQVTESIAETLRSLLDSFENCE